MRAVVDFAGRRWSRLALLGAVAVGIAGCSADTARFGNPNTNPWASNSAPPSEVTGTVQAAPAAHISSQSLPPPNTSRPSTVASVGVSGGGGGLGSYNQSYPQHSPSYPQPAPPPVHAALPPPPPVPAARGEVTGSIARQSHSAWNWDGGTAIVVGSGETAETLGNKYGVPARAILEANGLHSSAEIRPGQRLVIPKYNHAAAEPTPAVPPAPHHYAPSPPAAPPASTGANVHIVARGETLMSISRRYHKPAGQIAAANHLSHDAHLRIGDRIFIPGRVTEAHAIAPPAPAAPKVQAPQAQAPAPRAVVTAEANPGGATAHVAVTGTQAAPPTAAAKALAFRWPVRGRVIGTFGTKPNGERNDGIDLAVPQGTEVRAAEDGVVAYSGNELKGYGKLVLIRHEDGYVTAYANASEILVKRNDKVRRGQVIAKSGQTGGVPVPQLHFEIRKGSTPVDPSQFLPTGT
jgi:murein DD-endopeptidase MepM/ murein hydrolase activator NlpD